ncbi:MAG: hypothetical protein GX557_11535 [Chloroflexi bacterium]|nr:hypothetical protein [Chloroflexota bacterium]
MVHLDVFSGDPPCPGCLAIIALAEQVAAHYSPEELVLTVYSGQDAVAKFQEYGLACVPAAVVNGTIRIEGMCPTEATLNNALREGGLCLK